MKILNIVLFFSQLLFLGCGSTSIEAEGKLKIKNMNATENASDITHVKIMLSDSEKSIVDADVQIVPGIVKTFNLEATTYTVYVYSENNEKPQYCQCIVGSGKSTYLIWEKKEEMNNQYLLYEVNGF